MAKAIGEKPTVSKNGHCRFFYMKVLKKLSLFANQFLFKGKRCRNLDVMILSKKRISQGGETEYIDISH